MKKKCSFKLKVINIGLQHFADSLKSQGVKLVKINWRPPVKRSKEIDDLLDDLL